MSWTQAICCDCWDERNPDRPTTALHRENESYEETCCWCGERTVAGIYVRANPEVVPFPRKEVAG